MGQLYDILMDGVRCLLLRILATKLTFAMVAVSSSVQLPPLTMSPSDRPKGPFEVVDSVGAGGYNLRIGESSDQAWFDVSKNGMSL